MAAGDGEGQKGAGGCLIGLIWSILWIIVLIFVGWPLAFFLGFIYVILLPFSACLSPLREVCESLLKAVQLPLACAEGVVQQKPMC